ncbi:acyltransferase family protein [Mucilaginibacter psychrotolerans]|uniref:Acyltransferase n=1 Tax=Mucilaginibacter psychrotolerans TaxID=1524096 RepID=A0A4Y8SQD2_9SPHI|nr:acyltransferase [Mucilaginibacter psychrotolerans]TFF40865.1 acyltransferase [Mucilaginibacter psychrotolerans]
MKSKENAFDLLRLLLALSVVITHSLLLGNYQLLDPVSYLAKGQTNFGELGVMGFFSLSGYLITGSFENTANIGKFITHRLLRILPGFWVCLFITSFVLAPIIYTIKTGPLSSFSITGEGGAVSFFFCDFLLKINQWSIKNVLTNAAYKGSLNGSLWSLYPEVQCYVFTVIAGWFGLFGRNKMLYLITFVSVLAYFAISFNFIKNYGPTLIILSPALKVYVSYFAGSLIYVFKDQFKFDLRGSLFALLFALLLLKFGGFHLVSPLLIAVVLINIFQQFKLRLRYDLSYGIYIYSFPVQHMLFQLTNNRLSAPVFVLTSFLLSIALAFLSFVLIERPFINLRKKTDALFAWPLFSNSGVRNQTPRNE